MIVGVERVGVGIRQHVARVTLDNAGEPGAQDRIDGLIANVGNRLRGRVAQPHRRNVAGLHVRRRVVLEEEVVEQRVKEVRGLNGARATPGHREDERLPGDPVGE